MKTYNITVNGKTYTVNVEEVGASASVSAPVAAPAAAPVAAPTAPAAAQGANKVTCPLPGAVVKVCVNQGDTVKKGTVLCIVEAMKMENEVVSSFDGTVASVNTSKGASVQTGDLLFTIS